MLMRFLIIVILLQCTFSSFSQKVKLGDSILSGNYDTTRIEIISKKSFPFCSQTYLIPRECNDAPYANCCTYMASLSKNEKVTRTGSVSCQNGSILIWDYEWSTESAKQEIENRISYMQKQQIKCKVSKVKCLVMGKESEGYSIESEYSQGHKSYELLSYGSHNGYFFILDYRTVYKLNSNEDIQPFFQNFVQMK